MCLLVVKILCVIYRYLKFHLSFEYVKNKVSFEIYFPIEVKSRKFNDYSEFIFRWGCYAALMRPNEVEMRLQLQNGLAKVHTLVGRLAIGWVRRVFMACSCYFTEK